MEQYLIPIILIVGTIAAIYLTKWVNWLTWGENKAKTEALEKRKKDRADSREKEKEGNGGDNK